MTGALEWLMALPGLPAAAPEWRGHDGYCPGGWYDCRHYGDYHVFYSTTTSLWCVVECSRAEFFAKAEVPTNIGAPGFEPLFRAAELEVAMLWVEARYLPGGGP